jgi:hypothetical protein
MGESEESREFRKAMEGKLYDQASASGVDPDAIDYPRLRQIATVVEVAILNGVRTLSIRPLRVWDEPREFDQAVRECGVVRYIRPMTEFEIEETKKGIPVSPETLLPDPSLIPILEDISQGDAALISWLEDGRRALAPLRKKGG